MARDFDGQDVDAFEVRFLGGFPVDPTVGETQEFETEQMFLVSGPVAKSQVSTTKAGLVKRTNVIRVASATPVAESDLTSVALERFKAQFDIDLEDDGNIVALDDGQMEGQGSLLDLF